MDQNQETVALAAAHQITPPQQFDFSRPEEWPKWKKRYERYMQISNNNASPEEEKIDMLIYVMGEKAEDVLIQIKYENYEGLLRALDEHFAPKKNVVYLRSRFNKIMQGQEETVKEFVRELHLLAEGCNFGELKDELIRDRLVVGVKYKGASEKMQLSPDLSLPEAVTVAQQYENMCKEDLDGGSNDILHTRVMKKNYPPAPTSTWHQCWFCGGKKFHKRENCPARNGRCEKCHKMGHFKKMCRTGSNINLAEVTEDHDRKQEDHLVLM